MRYIWWLRNQIFFALIAIIVLMYSACFNCEKFYEHEKKLSVTGRIVNKFQSANHAEPILEIKTPGGISKQGAYFQLLDLWHAAEIGDSISKAANSLQYCLIKKDTIICFYPDCNGVKMK